MGFGVSRVGLDPKGKAIKHACLCTGCFLQVAITWDKNEPAALFKATTYEDLASPSLERVLGSLHLWMLPED